MLVAVHGMVMVLVVAELPAPEIVLLPGEAAKAGAAATRLTTGATQAAPATRVRRRTPPGATESVLPRRCVQIPKDC